jgi:predicted transcriptional regulator
MAKSNPVELTAEIVSAFVSYNPVPKGEVPAVIHAGPFSAWRPRSETVQSQAAPADPQRPGKAAQINNGDVRLVNPVSIFANLIPVACTEQ